jgi:hypothetical protein
MQRLLSRLGALLLLLSLSCQSNTHNPAALWIDYLQSELNLVLVDHEPPPF